MARRIGIGVLTLLLLVVIGTIEAPQKAVASIGPGGALAVSHGPKEIQAHAQGYAVDGDTLEVWVDDQELAIGLIGVRTPMGNTDCGVQATIALNKLFKQGIRLEEDPNVALDGRKRRMYRGYTLDGQPIAQRLVQAGLARTDGRGVDAESLNQLEDEAHGNQRGCVWQGGELQKDLRGSAYDLRLNDKRELPSPPKLGNNPLDASNFLVGLLNLTDVVDPTIVLAQTATPTPVAPSLPSNFVQDTLISSGLTQPTGVAWLPDGRMLVSEKSGLVMLYKNGQLQSTPFIDIRDRVNGYFDHGLIGMAVDPNFATNNYIYLLYTYEDNPTVFSGSKTGRLARYTASGDTASPSSEFVVLGQWVGPSCEEYPAGYDCIPSDDLSHSVGNIKFAADGTMFLTTGDGASFSVVDPLALRSQSMTSLGGKLLHITTTGQGLASNPFYTGNPNDNQSKIWDLGLRNPYRFNIRPSNNTPFVGQVGWNTWEDIYVGTPGHNFGWPCYEGNFQQSGYAAYSQCQSLYSAGNRTGPLISYGHYAGGTAVTGGMFYTGSNFPSQYQGTYFYSDYGHGFLHNVQVDANNNLISDNVFMPDLGASVGIVNVEQGPDGFLYYVGVANNTVARIRFVSPTSPPLVTGSADQTHGLLPLAVNFSSAGTSDPNGRPLTYDWDFGDGSPHSTAANPSHTYTVRGTYTARLTVTNNVPASNSWQTTIAAGSNPPTVAISAPSAALQYKVGDTISYAGSGNDFDGTPLTGSALAWQIIIHHCPGGSCHTHYLWQGTGASGSVTVPDHGDNVYLEFILTATNNAGLQATTSVSVHPQTSQLTLDSNPSGLQVVYDGDQQTTPRTITSVVGGAHTLYSPSPQVQNRATFASWSDGGAQQHNITTPGSNASYTVNFNVGAPPVNHSLAFDGSSSFAASLISPSLNLTGDWTTEAWFKDENPAGYSHDVAYIVDKSDTNSQGEAPYIMDVAWNKLEVSEMTGWNRSGISYDLVGHNVSANVWHHAAATLQASTNTMTLYLDGVQVAQGVVAGHSSPGNSLPVDLGRNGTAGGMWRGKLDEVRIWNVVRTPAQIAANWNTIFVGAPTGLVSDWQLDEGTGTSSIDNTPTGANLTLTNTTWSTDTPQTPASGTATPTATPTQPAATATPQTCPCTVFPSTASPTNTTSNDANAVELGMKFRVDTPGFITGVRFYKLSSNTGTHIGSLWDSAGNRLATATFTGETASGWQQVTFSSSVAVTANTTYVVSYFAPGGHYAVDQNYFTSSVDRAPIHGLADGASGGNGVYMYTATSAFPSNSFAASNYWVDAVFNSSAAATATPTNTPVVGATSTPTATPTNTPIPASTSTPTPTATTGPVTCPCTIFASTATPGNPSNSDTGSVELGVKFTSDQSGFITGVRFYKGSGNTGTHVGSLWSSTGTLLAQATFTGETASGWQQVNFSPAVAVTAGTTYVASYHAPNGHYAGDLNTLNTAINNPPLHALASGASGGNGVYNYSASSSFPTNTYQGSNYWVDVVFSTTQPATPTPTNTPTTGPTATPTATSTPPTCPCTIWPSTASPTNTGASDANAVEVGVKFRSDSNGFITGIRFYKWSTNTGTHVVNLWSSTGTLLASATASGETASGWQQANFTSPVAITAGTTYVASYHTNVGHYAVDQNFFSAGVDNPPLHALSNGAGGGNGVYIYSANSAFPNNTYLSSNYWVDVSFHP